VCDSVAEPVVRGWTYSTHRQRRVASTRIRSLAPTPDGSRRRQPTTSSGHFSALAKGHLTLTVAIALRKAIVRDTL
jgi:hypothetical protein